MDLERTHVVTLRLHTGPGITGSVELSDGTAVPFTGWIELLDHLEAIVEDGRTGHTGMAATRATGGNDGSSGIV